MSCLACAHRGIDIFPTDDEVARVLVSCVDGVIEEQRILAGSQGSAWVFKDARGERDRGPADRLRSLIATWCGARHGCADVRKYVDLMSFLSLRRHRLGSSRLRVEPMTKTPGAVA